MQKDIVDEFTDHWTRVQPGLDSLAMGATVRIMLFGKYLGCAEEDTLSRYGVSLWQFDVLATLRGAGPPYALTPSQIMQTVMLTSGGMTNRLDRLEADGYIERKPSQTDRRSIQVKLTAKGRKTVDEAIAARFEVARQALAPLNKAEIKTLNDLLRKLVRTTDGRRVR